MAPKLYMMHMSPPCRAVLLVAKAIGLELDIEEVEIGYMRTDKMLKLNPQHTVPTLQDGDYVLWDSHAIAGYLVAQYADDDTLYPKEAHHRGLVDQRLHFSNSVLAARFQNVFKPLLMGISTEISEDASDKLLEAYGFMESFLEDRQWIAGDELTIADLCLLAMMVTCEIAIPVESVSFPRLSEWLDRGKELAYFEEANAEGLEKAKAFVADKLGH